MDSQKSKCLICKDSYPQKGLAFFKFPKDKSRLKIWMKELTPLLGILKVSPARLKDTARICARHFKDKDFINFKKNSLVHNACPYVDISKMKESFFEEKKVNSDSIIRFNSFHEKFDKQEKDTFQCGRCKAQFERLSQFIDHKRSFCKSSDSTKTKGEIKTLVGNSGAMESTFLITFENKMLENCSENFNCNSSKNAISLVSEQTQNESVSFIVNESPIIIGNTFPEQIIITPEINSESSPIVLNNTDCDESDENVILSNCDEKSDDKLPFTSPVESTNNEFIFSGQPSNSNENNDDVGSNPENITLENYIPYNSDCIYQSNNSDETSHIAEQNTQNLLKLFYEQISNENTTNNLKEFVKFDKKESGKGKTKLHCSFCGKEFEKHFNLQQHERVHTGERPFQCIICGRAFSQKSNVRKHMMRHKVWPQAQQTLKITADQSQSSVSQEFLDKMEYSCQYCTLSFKCYSQYKKHLTVHSNFKVYRCIQKGCNETFNDLDEFLWHSKIHASAEFQCHICLKVFTSLLDLGAHQYEHDYGGKDKKGMEVKLKCDVCHAQFKTAESLKNHMAVDSHNYECVHCQSVFSSERFLRRHMSTHLDPSELKYKCQTCKKTFRTQKYLRNHSFVHLEEKPFTCDHCDKTFASKYRLKRHLAIHLNQYLECPFKAFLGCFKTFSRKDKLRDHVATHSNVRLKSCQICSHSFSSVLKLNQHLKKDHKIVKNKQVLRCLNCCQSFRKHKQLMQHHCTVGKKNFKSSNRNKTSEEAIGSEAVSNIEIIMVPYVSESKIKKCNENSDSVPK